MREVIEVEWTEEDFRGAVQRSSQCCMIAMAIRRKFPGSCPSVNYSTIAFDFKGERVRFAPRRAVKDAMRRFDGLHQFTPGKLRLRLRESHPESTTPSQPI